MGDPSAAVDQSAVILKALADPSRLRLIRLLAQQGHALCVSALARQLGISQPAVSQHLRVLYHLGLVQRERRGYRVHYSLNRGRLAECRAVVDRVLRSDE